MKRVFLDTNILLDYGLDRERADYAENILALGEIGKIALFASYLTYANMGYILRHHSNEEIYHLIRVMRRPVTVLPCDATIKRIFTHSVKYQFSLQKNFLCILNYN